MKTSGGALAVGISIALLLPGCGGGRSSHEGRTVAEWMEDLESPEYEVNERAVKAIAEIGEAAVPALTAALKGDSPRVRVCSLLALRELGPKAKAAIPALRALFEGSEDALGTDRQFFLKGVAAALGKMGPEGIRALLEVTKFEAPKEDLSSFKDPAFVARQATKSFFLFEAFDPTAVPTLIDIMNEKDADPALRAQAMLSLGFAGKGSDEAVRALVGILKDPQGMDRFLAAETLMLIAPENDDLYRSTIEWLGHEDPRVRWSAACILEQLGGRAAEAVPLLEAALEDEDDDVRSAAAAALKAIRLETEEGSPNS
ncbi:MAG: HEAT repeat domain-containing protein [Planctomycetes bacterium]|nr:HEAT repeat domain-containing protein [Planctomycetota bacterium]